MIRKKSVIPTTFSLRRSIAPRGLAPQMLLRALGLLLATLLVACSTTETADEQSNPVLGSQKQAATVGLDESYVVFALDGAWIKHHTKVHSGNIGADQGDFAGPYVRGGVDLKVGHHVSAGDASIFANQLEVGRVATVGKAYYKDGLDLGAGATCTETQQVTDAYFPLFPVKPEMPDAVPGTGENITVGWFHRRTLTPGSGMRSSIAGTRSPSRRAALRTSRK